VILIDLDVLRESDLNLYESVRSQTGQTSGLCEVDTTKLHTDLLLKWAKRAAAQPAPLPSEQEILQRSTEQARGIARLQQYVDEQNLAAVPENATVVQQWLEQNSRDWSAASVDAAIQALKDVLVWKHTEPVEVLEPWQLPLDADEAQLKKSDPKALKDYLSRIRKQRPYVRSSGSFGSTF